MWGEGGSKIAPKNLPMIFERSLIQGRTNVFDKGGRKRGRGEGN